MRNGNGVKLFTRGTILHWNPKMRFPGGTRPPSKDILRRHGEGPFLAAMVENQPDPICDCGAQEGPHLSQCQITKALYQHPQRVLVFTEKGLSVLSGEFFTRRQF